MEAGGWGPGGQVGRRVHGSPYPPDVATSERRQGWSATALRRVPNVLTAFRLAVVPVFAVLLYRADHGHSILAGVLFCAAAATDWIDGRLARALNVESRFGRLVDPFADRLLIATAVILLWRADRIHLLAVIVVLGRDLLLLAGLSVAAAEKGYELSVVYLGKLATFVIMAALLLIILTRRGTDLPVIALYIGVSLSVGAAVVYVATLRRRLRGTQPKVS